MKLSSILLALRMAIKRSIKKKMAMPIKIASGIINTPPFTNNENKDSFPAEEVAIPVLSICNRILNMCAGFYFPDSWRYNYAKTVSIMQ
jgi:hypothetical protein